MATGVTNWSRNYAYQAAEIHHPATVDELRSIVARAPKIRALGSRHCFNDIADSAELIALDRLDPTIAIDPEQRTVTINPSLRYGDIAPVLNTAGWALHNMASLPHISVGGAVATATHGSGDKNGNLATAVTALELVTSDGDIVQVGRGDDDFAGIVVGIGTLGVVTSLTLEIQPTYLMRQEVLNHLPWPSLLDQFDAVMSSAESVSVFLRYAAEDAGQIWLKTRVDPDDLRPLFENHLGAKAAVAMLHPVPDFETTNLTEQGGVPGPWMDRLPHFRLDAIPASGNELQSEYMVARSVAPDALRAIRAIAPELHPLLLTSEIRSVAADELWLSSAYGRDTICFHFSFKNDSAAVELVLPKLEAALAPFKPRPHWGKLFVATAAELEPRYPRMDDFRRLANRLDPRGAFRNAYLERHVFG